MKKLKFTNVKQLTQGSGFDSTTGPLGLSRWLRDKDSAFNAGNTGSIPGLGRPAGEGNGDPLQYSCLVNPMDRKPGRLRSVGLQRLRYSLATKQQLDLKEQSYEIGD
ncbi:unnamed protein product [Rangifer tarandus platyrhynchus]|uniref:Uncharacterized protein n=1 Tax=Rangifer tarandus platyrhynchus TaxID=3082113 RepID=A0AC59ZEJ0_RANTA